MALERSAILNREVAALISRYAAVDTMRPDVSELAKSPKYLALFRDVLENHISMIKTRSQTISDGKITVYDKALLVLTTNGKNPLNLGAMELFLDEFLGVRRVAEITGFEKVLQKNIGLRSMLWLATHEREESVKGYSKEQSVGGTTENSADYMNDDEIEEPFKKGNSRNRPGGYSMAVSKLLETLQRAEAEFHAIEDKHSARKFRAAKFLRDTAENTMAYFRTNGLPDQRTMRRIEKSYWLGHQATLTATGGRHRPFEMNQREYSHRTRQLKAGRTNFGRADCYRPGEERRSPTERVGRDTRRL